VYRISGQSRSGGGGGMHTVGYDGAQFPTVVVVVAVVVLAVVVGVVVVVVVSGGETEHAAHNPAFLFRAADSLAR
jgi:predicted metalloprotease